MDPVWANSHGGSAGDSARDVRVARDPNVQAGADALERIGAAVTDSRRRRTPQVTAGLLAGMDPDE